MEFAPRYIWSRLVFRLRDFFHHWYEHGTQRIAHAFISLLESLDQTFAVAITARHFFEPLYKDYTVIGRIVGVVFRASRILLGLTLYLAVACVFAAIYFAWLALPPYIIWHVATGF